MLYNLLPFLVVAVSINAARAEPWPLQQYKSTNFSATTIEYTKQGVATSPGYLFIEPQVGGEPQSRAPTIITDEGELIWRTPYQSGGSNFNAQELNGETYLTYWDGDGAADYGAGYGAVYFLDHSYNQVYKACQADLNIVKIPGIQSTQPCLLDLHESRMTSRGTLLATVRNVTTADLSSVGGPKNGYVYDSIWVEVDPTTDKLLFLWSAAEHIDQLNFFELSQSKPTGKDINHAWDFFHMNSVAEVPEPMGGYITSARILDAGIKLDRDGNVEWYVQGVNGGGNFTLANDTHFRFQHDIVPYNVTKNTLSISMFDDENRGGNDPRESSGLELALDVRDFTGSVQKRLLPTNFTASPHTGGMQILPDGHSLVDFGTPPMINEYDADNNLIYTARVGTPNSGNYRAYKLPWVGSPKTKPSVVSFYNAQVRHTTVYVSWNGATEVKEWRLSLLGQAFQTVAKNGFETRISMDGLLPLVQVAALDLNGKTLGQSEVVLTQDL